MVGAFSAKFAHKFQSQS